jgi:hypothetical protein
MTAPSCPVSNSQIQYYNSLFRGKAANAPVLQDIPIATDLASLIRTVNAISSVLRQLTTSLTVNNLYLAKPPNYKQQGNKYYSQYPQWIETGIETATGYVFHKTKDGPDPTSRAYVVRQFRVHYENQSQQDPEFIWSYSRPLDAGG